jgi:hypothetical protein
MKDQEILKAHRDLMAFLAKAAGVDGKRLKAITCRCEHRSWPEFTVELLGEENDIRDALTEQEKKEQ